MYGQMVLPVVLAACLIRPLTSIVIAPKRWMNWWVKNAEKKVETQHDIEWHLVIDSRYDSHKAISHPLSLAGPSCFVDTFLSLGKIVLFYYRKLSYWGLRDNEFFPHLATLKTHKSSFVLKNKVQQINEKLKSFPRRLKNVATCAKSTWRLFQKNF